jgi:hypothetical protein
VEDTKDLLNLQLTLTHQIIQTCMKFKLSIWLMIFELTTHIKNLRSFLQLILTWWRNACFLGL